MTPFRKSQIDFSTAKLLCFGKVMKIKSSINSYEIIIKEDITIFDNLTPLETSTFPQLCMELPISVRSFLYKQRCRILFENFINQVEIKPTILTRHHKLWFPLTATIRYDAKSAQR